MLVRVLLVLSAAALGVEAWTVMTSAIDRPVSRPRRRRHRAAAIELEDKAGEAAAAKAGDQAATKVLRNRQRRRRVPPLSVQNVTDEWLGQAAQRARIHRPQRAPSARRLHGTVSSAVLGAPQLATPAS